MIKFKLYKYKKNININNIYTYLHNEMYIILSINIPFKVLTFFHVTKRSSKFHIIP